MNLAVWTRNCAYPPGLEMEAVIPFAEGWQYWQVDLGGRDVVEQLGQYYRDGVEPRVGSRALAIVSEIDNTTQLVPEGIAIYVRVDEENGGIPIPAIYQGARI